MEQGSESDRAWERQLADYTANTSCKVVIAEEQGKVIVPLKVCNGCQSVCPSGYEHRREALDFELRRLRVRKI